MSGPFGVFSTRYEESRKRTVPDRVLITRVYKYIKPYRRNLVIGVVAILLSALTGLLSPYLHKVAIDQIIQPRDLSGFIWWVPLFHTRNFRQLLASICSSFPDKNCRRKCCWKNEG